MAGHEDIFYLSQAAMRQLQMLSPRKRARLYEALRQTIVSPELMRERTPPGAPGQHMYLLALSSLLSFHCAQKQGRQIHRAADYFRLMWKRA
jgi:hypothetical protein